MYISYKTKLRIYIPSLAFIFLTEDELPLSF